MGWRYYRRILHSRNKLNLKNPTIDKKKLTHDYMLISNYCDRIKKANKSISKKIETNYDNPKYIANTVEDIMYDHIGSALLIYMMDFQKYDINSNEKRVAYAIQMKEMGLKIAQYIQKKKKIVGFYTGIDTEIEDGFVTVYLATGS